MKFSAVILQNLSTVKFLCEFFMKNVIQNMYSPTHTFMAEKGSQATSALGAAIIRSKARMTSAWYFLPVSTDTSIWGSLTIKNQVEWE